MWDLNRSRGKGDSNMPVESNTAEQVHITDRIEFHTELSLERTIGYLIGILSTMSKDPDECSKRERNCVEALRPYDTLSQLPEWKSRRDHGEG